MVAKGNVEVDCSDADATPVVDRDQIEGLLAAAGAAGTREIMAAFWRSTDSLLVDLKSQLAEGRLVEAARTAHALKGSALNVGALRFSCAARAIEDACKRQDGAAAARKVDAAKSGYDATIKAIDTLIAAAG